MTLDVIAYERHFIDHLAPVWQALPPSVRGRFITDPDLAAHARGLGIEVAPVPAPRSVPTEPRFDGPRALVASYGDIKKGRRLGYGPFAFLEHGIGQSYAGDPHTANHASYSGGRDRDDVELNLVPNEHSSNRWRTSYPDTRTVIVGCPKLDSLPPREGGGPLTVALSFHFRAPIAPETKPAIDAFLGVVPNVTARWVTIGHAHPRFHGLDRTYRRYKIEYVPEFADVCRRADVYVCDNSSTIYEFASTGRPVVLLNAPGYRRNVEHGLRFWEAANVGVQVDHGRHLVDAIAEALADRPARQKARERALDIVYSHRTGAAERAAGELASWVQARQAVAA